MSTVLRTALVTCALALVGGAPASARIAEIAPTGSPVATPSCPASPCLAVTRTTGFQVKVGTRRSPYRIPRDGRIVAWSVTLGKPGPKQVDFFEKNYGGPASAGIAVLRTGKRLYSRTLALGPVMPLTKFFGRTVQFGLPRSIVVHRGEILALNVPTWAPALAVGLGNDTSWRGNRAAGRCRDTATQSATAEGTVNRFVCLYRTARLSYSATIVSTP